MRKLFSYFLLIMLVLSVLLESGCNPRARRYKNRKPPKAGKPIPCPMKDC